MRFALFALTAALALTPAAFAGVERCSEPYGPVLPKPATMTAEDLQAAKAEVLKFIKDSDIYQECLAKVMDDPAEKMTPAQKAAVQRTIAANQAEKEAIGNAYNDLANRYNAAHGAKK